MNLERIREQMRTGRPPLTIVELDQLVGTCYCWWEGKLEDGRNVFIHHRGHFLSVAAGHGDYESEAVTDIYEAQTLQTHPDDITSGVLREWLSDVVELPEHIGGCSTDWPRYQG